MNSIEIGKNIRKERKKKKYSQEKLAELVDCGRERISNYETGKIIKVDHILLNEIARVLDIDPKKLEAENYDNE